MSSDQPAGEPVIRTIAMPADTNPSGDIFGGWLMAQMDLAAGNLAARVALGRSATIAVEGMTCASCALLIEMKLKRDPRVREASVNFAAATVTVRRGFSAALPGAR